MDLTCPKCQGTMRTYERSGITVDQCTECRGIFLDRGELERLVDAETAFHGAAAAPAPAPGGRPPAPPSYGYPQDDRRDYRDKDYRDKDYREKEYRDREYRDKDYRYKDRDDDRRGYDSYHHKKRKRSLFEELFD